LEAYLFPFNEVWWRIWPFSDHWALWVLRTWTRHCTSVCSSCSLLISSTFLILFFLVCSLSVRFWNTSTIKRREDRRPFFHSPPNSMRPHSSGLCLHSFLLCRGFSS
jgi:hypothetical protein